MFSIALADYARMYRVCIDSQRSYAHRHGYRYEIVTRAGGFLSANQAAWLKIPLVLKALQSGYEWVFFIDADCEIRPHCPPIQQLSIPGKNIYVACGVSARINSGLIIVHNTASARRFFEHLLERCEEEVPREDRAPYENGHFIHYAKQSDRIALLDPTQWNNTIAFNPDSCIQHYASGPLRREYLQTRVTAADKALHRAHRLYPLCARISIRFRRKLFKTRSLPGLRKALHRHTDFITKRHDCFFSAETPPCDVSSPARAPSTRS
jgi:hypothetical protein